MNKTTLIKTVFDKFEARKRMTIKSMHGWGYDDFKLYGEELILLAKKEIDDYYKKEIFKIIKMSKKEV